MGDNVNHPDHYNMYDGIEIIDLVEQMNFNRGNAVKYLTRAGFKGGPAIELEDLKKAQWYLGREIGRLEADRPIIDKMVETAVKPSNGSSVLSAIKTEVDKAGVKGELFGKIRMLLDRVGIPVVPANEILSMIMAAEAKYRLGRIDVIQKNSIDVS